MKLQEMFKGGFITAADLGGKIRRYTIIRIAIEEVGDESKPVMQFKDCDQALVLNKTNATTLTEAWGDESDGWIGKLVELRPEKTDYAGKRVDCIRVAVPPAPTTSTPEAQGSAEEVPF